MYWNAKSIFYSFFVVGLDNTIGEQCLVATGRQRLFKIGVISGACVNFFVNLFLIPRFGGYGAAIGSLLAEVTILCIFIYCGRDVLNVNSIFKGIIHYGLLGMTMGICTWMVGRKVPITLFGLAIQVLTGGLVYFLLLIVTKDSLLESIYVIVKDKYRHI